MADKLGGDIDFTRKTYWEWFKQNIISDFQNILN